MIINLSPVRDDSTINISVNQDVITLNGVDYDFSPLQEGDSVPASAVESPWFTGEVTRTLGEVIVTIRLPHGAYAGEAARFPVPITVIQDGPVQLPDSGHDAPLPAFSGPVVEPEPVEEESHEQD